MGKKKLDKLFQEKFSDFSDMPDDKVWHSIETSLDEKKKSHKIIPLWWKLGGVAAVVTLAIFLLNPFWQVATENPTVTDVNKPVEKTSEEKRSVQPSKKDFENATLKKSQIVGSEEDVNGLTKETQISVEQITNSSNEAVNSLKSDSNSKDDVDVQKLNKQDSKIVNNTSKNAAVQKDLSVTSTTENEVSLLSDGTEVNSILNKANNTQEVLAKAGDPENFDLNKNGDGKGEDEKIVQLEKEAQKKSIFDEIASQESEEEDSGENSGSKWSAGPNIAPVYFNAIGEGSPVHSIFVPNSKSGDVTLSYGLSVAYEISKKLSIRSGIHKVDFGYDTNDVEFSSSIEASAGSQMDHVDYALTAKNLVVSSKSNTRVEALNQNPFLDSAVSEVLATSAARNGVMEQQFGYIEVPVELNYALIDNRFGINLIGGVSSLFLIDNLVSLSSGDLTTEIGEANNVNNVNFSTNVGFGLNYKFTSKIKLNIEPVFKYQMNTFSATDGTFQPFSVGVYSGLSFKF